MNMITAFILSLCLNFVIPDATYYIYTVEEPVARETLRVMAIEKVSVKDEAACFSATIPLRRIGDKTDKVVAYAGSQWGSFELKGDHVVAQQTCKSTSGGLSEFLKKNGYERIPEKEE